MQPKTRQKTEGHFIELRHVSKHFKSGGETRKVLRDANLAIRQGEFLAIVGPSGSGKTTLAQIVGGLTRPSAGEVVVAGQRLQDLGDRQLSRYRNKQVGFVFQNFHLLPAFTAIENVAVPLLLRRTVRSERNAAALRLLQAVGLSAQAHQFTHELSGGQRQRVAIARALIARPQIIIADEPTGNLDTKNSNEVAELLHRLNREQGVTLLLVTHNPELARRANRIVMIRDGQLQEGSYARA